MKGRSQALVCGYVAAFILAAFAAGAFAMGGGREGQRPADEQRGMQDRVDAPMARDPQEPPRKGDWQEEQPAAGQERQGDREQPGLTGAANGFQGVGPERPQHTYSGFLERSGGEYVLKVGDRSFRLEAEDDRQLEGLLGRKVEVWGVAEGDMIHVDSVLRSGGLYDPDAHPDAQRPAEDWTGQDRQPADGQGSGRTGPGQAQ
jgi:hypothetical protein